jgi:hypothetical protein
LLCQLLNSTHYVSRRHLSRARTKIECAVFGSDIIAYLPQLLDICIKIRASSAVENCGVAGSGYSNHAASLRSKCMCIRLFIDALSTAVNYLALVKISLRR